MMGFLKKYYFILNLFAVLMAILTDFLFNVPSRCAILLSFFYNFSLYLFSVFFFFLVFFLSLISSYNSDLLIINYINNPLKVPIGSNKLVSSSFLYKGISKG